MAMLSRKSWEKYSGRQAAQREAAAGEMAEFAAKASGTLTKALAVAVVAREAVRLSVKHGRAAAALACVWYDRIAAASGVKVAKAVPSVVSKPDRLYVLTDKAGRLLDVGDIEGFSKECGYAVASEVKRSGSRTMMSNARRDGAQFAWIPNGSETCAFCIALASNGWKHAKRSTAMGDHAEHIHPNCECEFAIRFDNDTEVAGYDPAYYEDVYKDADGRSSKDKINAIRRDLYAENKEKINAQHRERYAALHGSDE